MVSGQGTSLASPFRDLIRNMPGHDRCRTFHSFPAFGDISALHPTQTLENLLEAINPSTLPDRRVPHLRTDSTFRDSTSNVAIRSMRWSLSEAMLCFISSFSIKLYGNDIFPYQSTGTSQVLSGYEQSCPLLIAVSFTVETLSTDKSSGAVCCHSCTHSPIRITDCLPLLRCTRMLSVTIGNLAQTIGC